MNEKKAKKLISLRIIEAINLMRRFAIETSQTPFKEPVDFVFAMFVSQANKVLLEQMKKDVGDLKGEERKAYVFILDKSNEYLTMIHTACVKYCDDYQTKHIPNIVFNEYCNQVIKSLQ